MNITNITKEETRMIKAIQKSIELTEDGIIDSQDILEIANKLSLDIFPLTLELHDMPVIISKDILAFDPNTGVGGYTNTISGSFTYPKGDKPCSILMNNNQSIRDEACHAWLGYPETVIYKTPKGISIERVSNSKELSKYTIWAVGGLGLINFYNPEKEGFSKFTDKNGVKRDYTDVLRKTDHTALGVKNNLCYLIFLKNMNASEVNNFCKDKLRLEKAIMLDGGSSVSGITAINGVEKFAKINIRTKQGYGIQAI